MSVSRPECAPLLSEAGVEHGFACSDEFVPHVVVPRQVHGARVVRVPREENDPVADALFTSEPGIALGVRTADCVPILIAARSQPLVCAVHAGWRGSAARIAERAVETLCRVGSLAPNDLLAAIGPHIGPCCYEVDEPVRAALQDSGASGAGRSASILRAARPEHWQLDLLALNRGQLEAAGIPPAQICAVGGCTFCDPRSYPSYRRGDRGARMTHFIAISSTSG